MEGQTGDSSGHRVAWACLIGATTAGLSGILEAGIDFIRYGPNPKGGVGYELLVGVFFVGCLVVLGGLVGAAVGAFLLRPPDSKKPHE